MIPLPARKATQALSIIGSLVMLSGCAVANADGRAAAGDRGNSVSYQVGAGLGGELYPMFANYASLQRPAERSLGSITVIATNPTATVVRQRIAVQVRSWSEQEIQNVDLAPGATRRLLFAPSFLPRFYQNREILAATAEV